MGGNIYNILFILLLREKDLNSACMEGFIFQMVKEVDLILTHRKRFILRMCAMLGLYCREVTKLLSLFDSDNSNRVRP